jgi:hypothetical protein
VEQAVDAAEVHERTVLGDVLDDALDDHALFEVLEGLLPSARRAPSRGARGASTMLPRFLLNLMTLNWKVWPISLSRLRMGRRSTCEPGRKAFTPPRMVTERPPFTRG